MHSECTACIFLKLYGAAIQRESHMTVQMGVEYVRACVCACVCVCVSPSGSFIYPSGDLLWLFPLKTLIKYKTPGSIYVNGGKHRQEEHE